MAKVVTGEVRFSYLQAFTAKQINGTGEAKFSVSIIIDKDNTETLDKVKKAIAEAREEGRSSKWGGKIPGNLKTPLRDGDEERPDDPAYAHSYFFNATSKNKPGIVDRNRNPIIDAEELYSGCYGRVSVNFYPFDANGNRGVAAGLNNLQKLRDGERLSGGTSAEEDFDDGFDADLLD